MLKRVFLFILYLSIYILGQSTFIPCLFTFIFCLLTLILLQSTFLLCLSTSILCKSLLFVKYKFPFLASNSYFPTFNFELPKPTTKIKNVNIARKFKSYVTNSLHNYMKFVPTIKVYNK